MNIKELLVENPNTILRDLFPNVETKVQHIGDLKWSVKVYNALNRQFGKEAPIGTLLDMSLKEVLKIRNVGAKDFELILSVLESSSQ